MTLDLNIPEIIKDLLILEQQEKCLQLSDEVRAQIYTYLDNQSNIQKELGCPLDIAFKALTNGIYTKESEADDKLELFKVRGIEKNGLSVISKLCSYAECDFTCKYKDYKKTWWLKEDRSE